jgi:restriction system protein
MVLGNSDYPDYFPQEYNIDYNPKNNLLIVDYQLPPIDQIPTVKEVKYIQSRDEFVKKHISKSQLNELYDSILYQIALRTIHELYEADNADALSSIVFNGYVRSTYPATGKETNACVLSVQANKDEFLEINLELVDPKSAFKKLKGVGSSKLHSLVPIAPILKIDRVDKRFVSSYDVLFEKAFSAAGGEVKVTRASRDGGVDAVIFDPDPLRGGKIVVQAKRYTNVVGVSAVRDLYGTVVNEGANKGILVTTADYGPDAYKFAKGKPLQLLNGGNLLHLLEQHGHKARIDLKEAKKNTGGKRKGKR